MNILELLCHVDHITIFGVFNALVTEYFIVQSSGVIKLE